MAGMALKPDNYYDLAVVDPAYGINVGVKKGHGRRANGNSFTNYIPKKWDNVKPDFNYWEHLFRVTKNQIVFGGNYFTDFLPPSPGWIFWDKNFSEDFSFAAGELAFTSFDIALKKVQVKRSNWVNCVSTSAEQVTLNRIHPTQKPVALYDWIFKNYAKPGMKILDTHIGSGSSRIAADKAGLWFEGWELDPDYHAAQEARFREFVMNIAPADLEPVTRHGQIKLF
jgi:site-specific DNA-methyltransferase (adenine-specific)